MIFKPTRVACKHKHINKCILMQLNHFHIHHKNNGNRTVNVFLIEILRHFGRLSVFALIKNQLVEIYSVIFWCAK